MTNGTFILSDRVIEKIKALPEEVRKTVASALMNEFIFGEDPRTKLSPVQMVMYTFIKFDITRDMKRAAL